MNDQPSLDEFKDYIPGPYLTAIGKVCANWGILKAAMDLAIAKLAGFNLQDSRGVILVAHISWPLKMDILEAPVNGLLRDYPELATFEEAKPLLKKAHEGRNRVVHGHWGLRDGKVHKARMTARGKLKSRLDTVTLEELHSVALDVWRAGSALMKLVVNK